jgi:hypothetical protein
MARDLFAEAETRRSEPRDLFAERKDLFAGRKEEEPSEDSSDFVRGFTNYLPQLKETYGATKVLAGKATGSEELMKAGLATMEAAKQELRGKTKTSDSFTQAFDKGIGTVLTDWLPYQMGSGAANLLESLAVMGAGAAAGSVIPGIGTVAGGMTGLVEKELLKKGVKEAVEKIAKEEGEAVAEKYFEEQTKLVTKDIAKQVAEAAAKKTAILQTSALATQAGFHGAGETTSRAVEEAERLGKEATDIDLERVIPSAAVHGVAEFFGDKIGLGAFNKLDVGSKNLLLNFGKNVLTTGTKEAPIEVIQSTAERFGAKMSLADAEAVKEYIDAAAAAYGMSVGPAAGGAVKSVGQTRMDEEQKRLMEADAANMKMEQERQAGIEAGEVAKEAAADITKVGQVDENGNVTTPKDLFAGQQINAPATQITELGSEDTSQDALLDAVATKPAAGLATVPPAKTPNESPEEAVFRYREMLRLNMKDETGETLSSRQATSIKNKLKNDYGIDYDKQERANVEPPAKSDIQADQPSVDSTARELVGATTGVKAPDDSGVVTAGGPVESATRTEAVQRPALASEITDETTDTEPVVPPTVTPKVQAPATTKITEPVRRTIKLQEEEAPAVEKHTPEQAAYLKLKTKTRAKPAESIQEGMGYAAAESAFDSYDSAFSAINKIIKPLVAEEKAAREQAYKDAIARGEKAEKPEEITSVDILQSMPESVLTELFENNKNINKLTDERKAAMAKRDAFIKSLPEEQQKAIEDKAKELFLREIRAVKNLGRTTTQADLRKSREQARKEAVDSLLDAVEKPTRKVTPTKPKTGPTQIETLEQKRDYTIQKALESGEVDRVFAAIANERVNDSITAFLARKLYDVLKKFDARPNIVIGEVEDGHAGKYDPATETITIDPKNLGKQRLDVVALHEITHYMVDHVIDNRKGLTREQLNAINRLDRLQKYVNSKLGKQFDIGSLKEFVAQAFSNPEFQRAMGELPPMEVEGKKQNVFSLFAKRIMEMLGFRNRLLTREELAEFGGTYGNTLGDVLTQIEELAKVERTAPAKGVSYMAKAAPPAGKRTVEQMKDEIKTGAPNVKAKVKKLWSTEGVERIVTKFQNDRAAIKRWQQKLIDTGRLISYGVGFNNIYDQITLSSGNAHYVYTQRIQNLTEDVRAGVVAYANKNDITVDEALKELGLYAIAQHVEERSNTLYTMNVPLEDSAPIVTTPSGVKVSPAARRQEIFEELNSKKLSKKEAEDLWSELTKIVNDPANLSRDPKKADLLKRDSTKYSVAGEYTKEELDDVKKDYAKHKSEADPILDKIKQLNKVTLELNKESNYLSQYAENWINFYGWENYIPFKGKAEKDSDSDFLNFDSRRLGGELQDVIYTFEGRITQPDNPLLQVMADGAQAAMRVGRKYVTESIYNAAKKSDLNPNGTGVLNADVVKVIDFRDRADGKVLAELKGETKIFHYMPDGKVAIIQIRDPRQLEAIRRSYRETNPYISMLNKATSFVGQTHTRYNLAFAPINFVRDVLTNAYTLGAELGPSATFNYLGAIAADVAQGKMFKTNKFSRLYSKGKTAEIEALAKTDSYYRDLLDYVKTGGRVSYVAGLAARGQYEELYKGMGGGKIAQTKEQIDGVFDAWIDTFELSARVSAYRIAKSNEIARLTKEKSPKTDQERKDIEKAASIQAAAYAKNLANFEQVGEWGKTLGGFFMFFRPSATGAVRAMEAIAPAFQSLPQARMRLPEFARAANIREKLKDTTLPEKTRKDLEAELKENEKYISTFESNFAERQKNAKVMTTALIGMGFAVYLMSKMMADDDDLGRNKVSTDDMSRWTKFARFFFPGFDTPVQIPWSFGLGGLAAAGAQIAALGDNNVKLKDTLGNLITIGMDSFLPLPVSRINPFDKPREFFIDSMTPSIVRPIVEYSLNVDALGRQIYNNRQSRFGDAYTGGDNIPEVYKSAARTWFDLTGNDVSPNSLYFFANNYADGASRILLQAPVNLTLLATGDKNFNWKTDTIFLDSFFGTPSNFDARTWQKVEEDLQERAQRINMLKDKPDKYYSYLAKNPMDRMLVDMYNHDVNGTLKDLRAEANKYRAMEGISPKERKAIVDIYVKMANIEKYRLVEMYKAYGIKP